MKILFIFFVFFAPIFVLKSEITLKAKTPEEKDLSCITLLKLASEQSKDAGEMVKFEKLKKLKKSFLSKYEDGHFTEKEESSQIEKHNQKIKEKGKRYVNKGLQKCGLK